MFPPGFCRTIVPCCFAHVGDHSLVFGSGSNKMEILSAQSKEIVETDYSCT